MGIVALGGDDERDDSEDRDAREEHEVGRLVEREVWVEAEAADR
jgi:hypothetical protein